MNDNIRPVSPSRFWTRLWFWSVALAIVTVGYAALDLSAGGIENVSIAEWVQLVYGFITIAVLPPLVLYEIGHLYKHPPRRRPTWFWLLLTGILIGVVRNAYVIWDATSDGQIFNPVSVVISLLAWSVSFLFLLFCWRALKKFSRWMWVPRRRFWIWLWVWSLAVATVTMGFTARTRVFTDPWGDDDGTLVRRVIGFFIIALATLMFSYLAMCNCKNLPRSRKDWFWLLVAGVSSGIVWTLLFIWAGAASGVAFDSRYFLHSLLAESVVFLFLSAFVSSLVKLFRWLFSWRVQKRCLLALATLIVLVVTFYAEENWRGKRAWENCRRELAAKGEKFDLLSFAPPSVPDDQNFAMAPVVATSYESELDKSGHLITPPKTNIVNRMRLELYHKGNSSPANGTMGSWQLARLTDLNGWQDYYRATTFTNDYGIGRNIVIERLDTNQFPIAPQPQSPAADVLLALSRYDAVIAELRQAGGRPFSRFPLNYQDKLPSYLILRHITSLNYTAGVLHLRAIAELQAGQTEPALADVKLILRLAESIHNEPTLNSHLELLNIVNIAIQPFWEGLAERRWSEAQMKELGGQLEKLDLISDLQIALHGERVRGLECIDYMREHRDEDSMSLLNAVCPRFISSLEQGSRYLPGMPDVSDWFADWWNQILPKDFVSHTLGQLLPAGWYDWNKVALAKMYQERVLQIARPEQHLISRKAAMEVNQFIDSAVQPSNSNPQDALALRFVASAYTVLKTAKAQNAVNMAIVACALERYYLAQGEYPETLAVLAPKYLKTIPPDVVDGQPLHYRRTNDGRFLLYSVGWNGQDDGGVVGLTQSGRPEPYLGDWVWQYPANQTNHQGTR